MARRPKKVHPSLIRGEPTHGSVFPDDTQEPDLDEDLDNELNEPEDDDDAQEEADDLQEIRSKLARLEGENDVLKRGLNPPPPQNLPEEINWDDLLFTNPKEAMRLHGEQIRRDVKAELQGEYQKDQGEKAFWTDFYAKNKDLQTDKDLVQFMLSKSMAELGDMPVEKAMDRLADLTRQTILGYGNRHGGEKRRSRAVVEGANPPASRAAPTPADRPTTLSDILKARKAARRKGATAA